MNPTTLTERQRQAALLWFAAEGNEDAMRAFPGQTLERIQLHFSESVARGDLITQLQPVLKASVTTQFETIERIHNRFTRRNLMSRIGNEDFIDVFTPGDQSNIPETNSGDRFIPGGLPRVNARQPYPQIGFEATGKRVSNAKYGEGFGVDWETIVNSRGAEIDLVRSMLTTLGRHAAQNEDTIVLKQLFKAGGFADGLTAAGADQALVFDGNPAIDDPTVLPRLIRELLERQVNGQDVDYSSYALITSPSNALAIRTVMAAQSVTILPGQDGGLSYAAAVDLGAEIDVIGSRFVNRIWGGAGIGRGFALVPKATDGDLPVISANYLRGYEGPQVFVRDGQGRTAGGSAINPITDGDFDSDAMATKVRHVFGSDLLWTAGVGLSLGTNA